MLEFLEKMSNSDIDPSIAALLNDAQPYKPSASMDFERMVLESEAEAQPKKAPGLVPEVDLSIKEFKEVTHIYNDEPADWFDNPSYYKVAIAGEGSNSQRLHQVLSKYLTCKDSKDRMVYRQQVIMAYWEFIHSIAPKMADKHCDITKRMLMRFTSFTL